MKDSIAFAETADPDDRARAADAVAEWANSFDGAEAFVVYDYVDGAPADVNGVTIQWAIDENEDGEPEASKAIHVVPGQTVRRKGNGFGVSK